MNRFGQYLDNKENYSLSDMFEPNQYNVKEFKRNLHNCTRFVIKLGKNKKLWKPDKFRPSRKVKIAQSMEQLNYV